MSAFHERNYDVQFWVGTSDPVPPWSALQWTHLRPAFDAVVVAGRAPVKFHSSQIDRASGKHVKFGRLSWSVKGDQIWVPGNLERRYFENVEMWAPNFGVCMREGRSPDTYFDLTNIGGSGGYDWFTVAALAMDVPEARRRVTLANIHIALTSAYPQLWSASGRRQWGYSWGSAFEDGMQELSNSVSWNLRKSAGQFSVDILRGTWAPA